MSQENVEVVHRFIEALVEAQASDNWEPVLAELNPEVEIDDLDISLDTEHYQGYDSVLKWVGVWNESWQSWRLEDIELLPAGEERVVALFLMIVTGKGSGIELSRQDALACTLRNGKIVEMGDLACEARAGAKVQRGSKSLQSPRVAGSGGRETARLDMRGLPGIAVDLGSRTGFCPRKTRGGGQRGYWAGDVAGERGGGASLVGAIGARPRGSTGGRCRVL